MMIPARPARGSGAVDEAVTLLLALDRLGVRHVVFAPGSRSAPLVHAAALLGEDLGITTHVRIDERTASFTALGMSRADPAHPAAVVTTSGTATAHTVAAAMEARAAGIGLLVLTADRPVELRGTGANQTAPQAGLFAQIAALEVDVPAPAALRATDAELRAMANTAVRAVARARRGTPVHLNLGFRDPLAPAPQGDGADVPTPPLPPIPLTRALADPLLLDRGPRTLVVAGDGAGPGAIELAQEAGWPLLAEPVSGARGGATMITRYLDVLPAVLDGARGDLLPQRVVVLGRVTLSRPIVSGLLGRDDVETVLVSSDDEWPDAARNLSVVTPGVVLAPGGVGAEERFLSAWTKADQEMGARAADDRQAATGRHAAGDDRYGADDRHAPAAGSVSDDEGVPADGSVPADQRTEASRSDAGGPVLDAQRAALAVWDAGEPGDVLYLGSSSVARDLEAAAGPQRARVMAHRGVAGIDGMIAAASGAALALQADAVSDAGGIGGEGPGRERPAGGRMRLLIGDLTALHDATSLVLPVFEDAPALDVIVLDDDGGGIFFGLEHRAASSPDVMERFFGTPHGVDVAALARAAGWTTTTVDSEEALRAALAEPASGERRLLRVRVERPSRPRRGRPHP